MTDGATAPAPLAEGALRRITAKQVALAGCGGGHACTRRAAWSVLCSAGRSAQALGAANRLEASRANAKISAVDWIVRTTSTRWRTLALTGSVAGSVKAQV